MYVSDGCFCADDEQDHEYSAERQQYAILPTHNAVGTVILTSDRLSGQAQGQTRGEPPGQFGVTNPGQRFQLCADR